MKQIHCLRRDNAFSAQAAQQVGLRLLMGAEEPVSGSNLLSQQFAELPELYQASVRIIAEVAFGKRAEPVELRLVRSHETEVERLSFSVHRYDYCMAFGLSSSSWHHELVAAKSPVAPILPSSREFDRAVAARDSPRCGGRVSLIGARVVDWVRRARRIAR